VATIEWAESELAREIPVALAAPEPPPDLAGAGAWRAERDRIVAGVVRPAMGRWLEQLRELLPRARPAEQAGLCHLPGGAADYRRAIRVHTSLEVGAEELHRIGREEVDRLEDRCVELGASIGLGDLVAVHDAVRASSARRSAEEAIEESVRAIRRAEARAHEWFPAPLPPPCSVSPMPPTIARSGAAPHYTPPRLDGSRPGTYWFNTEQATAGLGWDLEGVAFHEAVPGHHLQLSRIQQLDELPALQRQRSLTVFSEGWGLYAEQLAEEVGLYSSTESLLGALQAALMRAARLVVDTGLHAFGWSREEALRYMREHVALPAGFLASEIDRYIVGPGQALSYLTGKRELLALRELARGELGTGFSLAEFHATVLDAGSLPLPVLRRRIESWLGER
jgi:uncharacterized protein (DUF885 family)